MSTQTVLIGVAGLAMALGAYTVLSGNPAPWKAQQPEPEGDPSDWSRNELKAWLQNRGKPVDENKETRVQLLARVQEIRK